MVKKFETKDFNGYEVYPRYLEHPPEVEILMEIEYHDDTGCRLFIELDAVGVYTNLKRYFKDTEYE